MAWARKPVSAQCAEKGSCACAIRTVIFRGAQQASEFRRTGAPRCRQAAQKAIDFGVATATATATAGAVTAAARTRAAAGGRRALAL